MACFGGPLFVFPAAKLSCAEQAKGCGARRSRRPRSSQLCWHIKISFLLHHLSLINDAPLVLTPIKREREGRFVQKNYINHIIKQSRK